MQYIDAIAELRKFANEPLDMTSGIAAGRIAEIRMATRSILKTLDARANVVVEDAVDYVRRGKATVGVADNRKESLKVRVVDYIRNAGNSGTHMDKLFYEFRISLKEMIKNISDSYGIVSHTIDSKGEHTFYYHCDSYALFQEKLNGKLPEGHTMIGRTYYAK